MSDIKNNNLFLLKKWRSLRLYNIVILNAFLFFYLVGTLQSYSFFTTPPTFNLPLIFPLCAIFLCGYTTHCLINKKDQQSIFLIPIIALFTTLFITINSHFEIETSQNSFLYLTLLLPLFYSYILSYNLPLLAMNNILVVLSYSFTAIIGETSQLVFLLNLIFLFSLVFLTLYAQLKNNNYTLLNTKIKKTRLPVAQTTNTVFLSSIIHDIRQPLSSLMLYSHLLEKRSDLPEQKTLIDNIANSSAQLDRWLSSLLELAKLDDKSLQPNLKNIPLETCFSAVIKKQSANARAKGLKLKVRFVKSAIYTDSKIVSEIIDNLLSNALIHGSQEIGTTVLLSARYQKTGINIQVWNKGSQIHGEQLNALFDELYYVNNKNHNKAKGIGLGLPLSQRKAKLINTKINVKSSNKGTCFSINIPKGVSTESKQPLTSMRLENSEKILLIDDDKSILMALSMLLKNWGYSVECAESSEQAIKLLESTTFMLIISDYQLPGNLNGIDLIKRAQKNQPIPSLLLTGDSDPDKLKGGELVDYKILHKPVKPAALRLLLRKLLSA